MFGVFFQKKHIASKVALEPGSWGSLCFCFFLKSFICSHAPPSVYFTVTLGAGWLSVGEVGVIVVSSCRVDWWRNWSTRSVGIVEGWYRGTLWELSWLDDSACAWEIMGTLCGSCLGVDVKQGVILSGAWWRGGGVGSSRRGCCNWVGRVTVVGTCTDWVGRRGVVPLSALNLFNMSVDWLEVSLIWFKWEVMLWRASCL